MTRALATPLAPPLCCNVVGYLAIAVPHWYTLALLGLEGTNGSTGRWVLLAVGRVLGVVRVGLDHVRGATARDEIVPLVFDVVAGCEGGGVSVSFPAFSTSPPLCTVSPTTAATYLGIIAITTEPGSMNMALFRPDPCSPIRMSVWRITLIWCLNDVSSKNTGCKATQHRRYNYGQH